jgi:hypothetical protein
MQKVLFQQSKEKLHTMTEDTEMREPKRHWVSKTTNALLPERSSTHVHAPEKGNGKGKGKGQSKGKGKGQGMQDPPQPSDPHFKVSLACKFCSRKGHYQNQCWQKQKEDRKKLQEAQGQGQQVAGTHVEFSKKRKMEKITYMSQAKTLFLECHVSGFTVNAVIDTGATISALSAKFTGSCEVDRKSSMPIQVGNGQLLFSKGITEVEVSLGTERLCHRMVVVDTDVFDAVLGMDFLYGNASINGLLFHPARLVVNNKEVLVREENHPKICTMFRLFKTESYRLLSSVRSDALTGLSIEPTSIQVDLLASSRNNVEPLFCSKENSAWGFGLKFIADFR